MALRHRLVWLGLVRLQVLMTGLTNPWMRPHTRGVRGRRLLAWLCIGVVVGLMLAPTTVLARPGGRGGGGRGHGGHHHGGHRGGHHHGHGFHHGGHGHKGFHHGGFGHGHKSFHVNFFDNGFHHKGHHFKGHHGFFSSCCAGVIYAPPAVFYPPAVSYVADYAPAPVSPAVYQVPVASPPPMIGTGSVTLAPAPPSVVEYPHGRYELRGDGVTTPYQWVWIPNPPPAPPPAAPPPPAVTPPAAPPAVPPPASDAPRPRIYRWTDDQGVTHWTNRADTVPPEHRKVASPATQP
jgi:hypothetical protein